jgi:hypothetical protein
MRPYSRPHRRLLRNRNAAPLMLVAEGISFADVLAALGRVLYRYRSELAPSRRRSYSRRPMCSVGSGSVNGPTLVAAVSHPSAVKTAAVA